jgi:hypothetical protein
MWIGVFFPCLELVLFTVGSFSYSAMFKFQYNVSLTKPYRSNLSITRIKWYGSIANDVREQTCWLNSWDERDGCEMLDFSFHPDKTIVTLVSCIGKLYHAVLTFSLRALTTTLLACLPMHIVCAWARPVCSIILDLHSSFPFHACLAQWHACVRYIKFPTA